jgi:hypothetical protein
MVMAFYKIRILRCKNTPSYHVVPASKSQDAVRLAAVELRQWGITDARAIEVICQVQSLRG